MACRVGRAQCRMRGEGRHRWLCILFALVCAAGAGLAFLPTASPRGSRGLVQRMAGTTGEEEGGILARIGAGIKSMLGLSKSNEKNSVTPKAISKKEPDFGKLFNTLPVPFRILGTLMKPLMGMMGSMMQDSQDDVQRVLVEAESALLRSGRFGARVTCGPILGQSYASMNINGQKSAQVQLQFQVQGETKSSTASCAANIGPSGEIELRDLRADGVSINARVDNRGGIIDVDR